MDGKGRAEGYPITWMGYSIGQWDGDTLMVDTIDIRDKTWIDTLGTSHSDALHLVERFRRLNHDTLEIEFAFDDPKAHTKPWKARKVYRLQPPGNEAIHAIGSVVAEQVYKILKVPGVGDPNEAYCAALERLTAERWRSG